MDGQEKNSWFIVQCKANRHRLAEKNLARQGFDTFLPMQKSTTRKSSCFVTNLQPLFPGYMFVGFNITYSPWSKINSTIGVSRLMCISGQPSPIPEKLISSLILRCDDTGAVIPSQVFKKGERVKLVAGPFANFVAKIEDIDSKSRVLILLDFLGQPTRTKVSITNLFVA